MIDLRLGRWQDALADVDQIDAVITDPPYGERTHAGHNKGSQQGTRTRDGVSRSTLNYSNLSTGDVPRFVDRWGDCRGWFVVLSDHELAAAWATALRDAGRYVFSPLPYVAPGSRVRLSGDGPSSWTCWIIVARPHNKEFATWGTLPGAYILPKGHADPDMIIGGKPLWLMRAIIRDYTRPGDLVCDPCAGGGTTLIAAAIEGRRAIGAEMDPDTYAKAKARIDRGHTPDMFSGQIGK